MNPIAFAVIVYLIVQLGIGWWASTKIKNEQDFLLAGRSLGLGLAAFSLFATWFGAETVMGSSSAIAAEGLAGARADPFGYSLCLLFMALLIAYRMRHGEYFTLADFFRHRFSRSSEILAVLVSVPTSLFWAAAQLLGFSLILSAVTGLGVSHAMLWATLFVITYTSMGGLLGDVLTDLVQGIIVIMGLTALLLYILSDAGGLEQAFAHITPDQLRFAGENESLLARLDTWMIPILGSLVSQEALGRLLATRSPVIARRACLVACGIYFVVGLVPALLGLLGPHLAPGLKPDDAYIITLAEHYMPTVLFIILCGALLSAILSTIDSTLLTVSSLTAHNLLLPMMPHISEHKKVWVARLCVVGAGALSYQFAVSGENIYGLLEQASSFGSAGILVCMLFGLWSRVGGIMAANLTLLTGMVSTVAANHVFETDAPFLFSLACCVITFALASIFNRSHHTHKTQHAA